MRIGGHDHDHPVEPAAAGSRTTELITTTLLLVSMILSWIALVQVGFNGHDVRVPVLDWIVSGDLKIAWALRIDTLTAVMLVVVNTVSALVHLYSIGYMHEDPYRPRFFGYLSLFTFAMLMLVTSDNLVQMFFGWEGVGLASYLLIGFWYHKPEANAAAIKAFVVNRVGDFGFALGIFALFAMTGAVDFDTIFAQAPALTGKFIDFFGWHADALTLICLLLFMGAMGKSAQFLLHTWLPDAMEGPTPVSALIHAATMVTAGVFMVARNGQQRRQNREDADGFCHKPWGWRQKREPKVKLNWPPLLFTLISRKGDAVIDAHGLAKQKEADAEANLSLNSGGLKSYAPLFTNPAS